MARPRLARSVIIARIVVCGIKRFSADDPCSRLARYLFSQIGSFKRSNVSGEGRIAQSGALAVCKLVGLDQELQRLIVARCAGLERGGTRISLVYLERGEGDCAGRGGHGGVNALVSADQDLQICRLCIKAM